MRCFAAHVHALDPNHELVPQDLLPQRPHRAVPYLYANAEVRALMDASSVIPTPHRAATMRTLIGLLAVTGMRVGEAIRLDQIDVDHRRGVLTVLETQVRQVPANWRSMTRPSRRCTPTWHAVTGRSRPSRPTQCSPRRPGRV